MTDIIELLDAIKSSNEIDVGSMQIYDAIALVAKQDKQIRSLCDYIAAVAPMQMQIDVSYAHAFTYSIGDKAYAEVEVVYDTNSAWQSVTIDFADRWPMFANAYFINNSGQQTKLNVDIANKTITISHSVVTPDKIYLQFV